MRTSWHWIARLFGDWAVIALCVALVVAYPLTALPLAWVAGSRLQALLEIGHMAAHRLCLGGPTDDALARLAFALTPVDLGRFRRFHLAHHRHLGGVLDPEAQLQRRWPQRWSKWRLRDSVADAFGLSLAESLVVLSKLCTWGSLARWLALIAALVLLAGWAALLIPLAAGTGLPLAHRLRAFTEHRHFSDPGITLHNDRPALWRRLWYLPHGGWAHAEHHRVAGR